MRNPPSKGLGLAPFFIHVVGEKVARLSCVDHNIGFRDGPAAGLAGIVQFEFLEIFLNEHGVRIVVVRQGAIRSGPLCKRPGGRYKGLAVFCLLLFMKFSLKVPCNPLPLNGRFY